VLIADLGTQYVRGLQEGEDDRYIKIGSCVKHFAVHDGPENVPVSREVFVAHTGLRDLYDTYLPQFQAAVTQASVSQVMCAYSSTNYSSNAPDCASEFLLKTVLRDQWGFGGSVISE
jgi:beta-glucosidase